MAIQTFVASTVLTAAQMNALQTNDYNQTVSTKTASYTLVAADKGTKIVMNSASATTITVNTSLFAAGDTLTILNISTGVCTVTAGTATVSSAGSLALSQYSSGTLYFTSAGVSVFQANGVTASASGLVLISTTTVGTTVGSVTVSNCFSATYLNYKIWYNGGLSSANNDLTMTIGSATANYNMVFAGSSYTTGTFLGAGSASAASFLYAGATETVGGAYANIELFNPFATANTRMFGASGASSSAGYLGGILKDTTSHTGFTFTPASGTLTGGTIRVYGYSLT